MKTKSLLVAFGFCVLLLSGCVASVGAGTDYGYYPPVAQPYYGPVRPYPYHYYPRRPIVVVPRPYYRQPYRAPHRAYRHDGGASYRRPDGGYRSNYGQGTQQRPSRARVQ
ncbi:MAG TPA: hypothetical protein VF629_22365 [Hymenobacter sp.]|jgi:hypothetical protein|uniref:hypothetical protein n=1 Tax=Hymenobacter sp. TaxID=1898978 RepID=UPI002ED88D35